MTNNHKIGCCTLVRYGEYVLAIECSKGRGIILPGGKWEPGETYRETAKRELLEETGLDVPTSSLKLIFSGVGPDGWFIYTFLAEYAFTSVILGTPAHEELEKGNNNLYNEKTGTYTKVFWPDLIFNTAVELSKITNAEANKWNRFKDLGSGLPMVVRFSDLVNGKYWAYYDCFRDVINIR